MVWHYWGMKEIFDKYGRDCVWHFTDSANIASIREHGLLSWAETQKRGITVPVPGGNDWSHNLDKAKELDADVHLAFIGHEHPMLHIAQMKESRLLNPVWLKIDTSVVLGNNVRFCATVANKTGALILNAEQAKEMINFEVLFANQPWKNPAMKPIWYEVRKSEILVPDSIPPEKILNLNSF
ncbi:MAG: DUF4433 domain-containing protein [Alphaproteobacteria bacterium]|nr:DUF4433 domain-containing protein [Alphaproteobacteria bacterium]MDA8022696.1 DUF4433 domain-containing protein [Gammaproteobacteria bacterium]MDA8030100.1 DUF4433 domain-containing protein [Alphaproteobacteria bacterium]